MSQPIYEQSKQITAEINAFIRQPPPRKTPRSVLRAAGGYTAAIVSLGAAFLGTLLIFTWFFQIQDLLVDVWLEYSETTTSTGLLESCEPTGISGTRPGGGLSAKSVPVYRLTFSYDTPQGKQTGHSHMAGLEAIPGIKALFRQNWSTGDEQDGGVLAQSSKAAVEYLPSGGVRLTEPFKVTVQYLPARPSWSRVQDTRFCPLGGSLGLAAWIMIAAEAGWFGYFFRLHRQLQRLLTSGRQGRGRIVEVRTENWWRVGRRETLFKAIVTFVDQYGEERTGRVSNLTAKQAETCQMWAEENRECSVWHLPGRSTIVIPELWLIEV